MTLTEGRPKIMPIKPGYQPGADKPDQERHPETVGQDRGGISPHRDKTGMADGKLPAIADQDIQPDRGNKSNTDEIEDTQPVVAQIQRRGEDKDQEANSKHPLRFGAHDGHVLGVVIIAYPAR